MPLPPSDRALKRLVTKLAMASADDIEAVLDQLEPAEREKTQALLANYVGTPVSHAASDTLSNTPNLSPWLSARLEDRPASRPAAASRQAVPSSAALRLDFKITPAAVEALRASVSALKIDSTNGPPTYLPPQGPSWFKRLRETRKAGRAVP